MATAPITTEEVHEYEAILRIRDQIFSGSHPRLKVPQQLVRKPGARNGSNTSSTPQEGKNKSSGGVAMNPAAVETIPSGDDAPATAPAKTLPCTSRVAPKPASEIDPIFLTKSDDLVRAELQLQRQRVERTLRDQLDQRKQCPKSKPALHDLKPDFNVSEVLNRAFELVKPVSLSDPSETNGPNDSFDDNSFYSSRAPDSPPPGGDPRTSSPTVQTQPAGSAVRVPVDRFTDELQRLEALNRPGSDREMQDAYHVADQGNLYSQKQPHPGQIEAVGRFAESQQADVVEEPEYSPPAPAGPSIDPRDLERSAVRNSGRTAHTDRSRAVQGPTSPAHNVRVVRNHITSPAAPRPSRVSPLAMAKVPSVHQIRDERPEQYSDQVSSDDLESGRVSANRTASQVLPRKRRKVQGRAENTRRPSCQQPEADLSDAYIKEEPESPPPFADDATVIRGRRPQEPVYIDIASPQYTPAPERRESHTRGPIYEVNPYHGGHFDSGLPRTVSRLSTRRSGREDADLRRVASMQYARQADHPRAYIEVESRGSRAPSYAVEQPLTERPRYYEEIPASGPRYIAVDDLHHAAYREPYYEEPPRAMHAPQSRIVVDELGNEYEMIPRMQPMAPPPRPVSRVSRVPRGDPYDDRVPVRNASVRAPSVIQDSYDRRYVPEMLPPQPVYRRAPADYARPVSGDRRSYVAPSGEGPEPYSHDEGAPVADYGPPTYLEERALPTERVIRTASIRPAPPGRYEEPRETAPRVGSVRPAGPNREVSVYMEERPPGEEYAERPYYVRERRYYEADERTAPSAPPAPRRY